MSDGGNARERSGVEYVYWQAANLQCAMPITVRSSEVMGPASGARLSMAFSLRVGPVLDELPTALLEWLDPHVYLGDVRRVARGVEIRQMLRFSRPANPEEFPDWGQ